MHPQLPLQFDQQNAQTFASFYCGPNAVLCERLKQMIERQAPNSPLDDLQTLIYGPPGTGKTHLLTAVCQAASSAGYRIAYLPGALLENAKTLTGLSGFDLVCIDDLHEIPGSGLAEMALFNFINEARGAKVRLVFASGVPLGETTIALPDLRTRLAWGAIFSLQALTTEDVRQAVTQQAALAGLDFSTEVMDYLLNHYPRDIGTQIRQIQELDRASLQTRRRLTIPLIREVLPQEESQSGS